MCVCVCMCVYMCVCVSFEQVTQPGRRRQSCSTTVILSMCAYVLHACIPNTSHVRDTVVSMCGHPVSLLLHQVRADPHTARLVCTIPPAAGAAVCTAARPHRLTTAVPDRYCAPVVKTHKQDTHTHTNVRTCSHYAGTAAFCRHCAVRTWGHRGRHRQAHALTHACGWAAVWPVASEKANAALPCV